MKRYKKEEKGITLIVLIITVIIMLILVAVVIDVAIDGKLIDSAKEAVEGTNDKVGQVQTRTDELMGVLEDIENENSNNDNLIKCEAGYNSINVRLYYLTKYEEYVRGKTIEELEQAVLRDGGFNSIEEVRESFGSLQTFKEAIIDFVGDVIDSSVDSYEDALLAYCYYRQLFGPFEECESVTVTAPDGSTYELGHGYGQILGFNYSVTESGTYEFIAENANGKKQKIKVPVEYNAENSGTFTLVDRFDVEIGTFEFGLGQTWEDILGEDGVLAFEGYYIWSNQDEMSWTAFDGVRSRSPSHLE